MTVLDLPVEQVEAMWGNTTRTSDNIPRTGLITPERERHECLVTRRLFVNFGNSLPKKEVNQIHLCTGLKLPYSRSAHVM